jgi:hypothetical protein
MSTPSKPKKRISVLIIALFCCLRVGAQNILPDFTSDADAFFKKYVTNGQVAYAAVQKDAKTLAALTSQIGRMNLAGAPDESRKAFYINAYNILVIQAVANQFPLKSVMDKPGFFDKTTHLVAGEKLTLNDLEKKKLLQPYADARLHFVLACAAVSCPPLASFAYTPEGLNTQLDTRTKAALNNPAFIRVSKRDKKVLVSKIFDWYQTDFTKGNQPILTYINKYRTENIPPGYQVSFYEYDWSLNKQ